MNKCILIGRLVRTPEVRYTQGAEAKAVCKFTIAVDRPYRGDNDRAVDFLNCVCFGKRGEAIGKYFDKGNKIAVTGRIQTGEYTDKQGIKKYTTDIYVDDFEFCKGRKDNGTTAPKTEQGQPSGFYSADNINDEDLPF